MGKRAEESTSRHLSLRGNDYDGDSHDGESVSRRLLELLAGKISQEEFLRHEDFLTVENPFEQALRAGRLVVSLERTEEDDDDWIVFDIGWLDPAISRFRMPETSKK